MPQLIFRIGIIWPHEKHFLKKHGLKAGMKVADICCGSGDFALLAKKRVRFGFYNRC